jgi:endonuclease/exonuclease/phosphatase family metal-dependent hydrolase
MQVSLAQYNVKNLFSQRDITEPKRQHPKSERSLAALAESLERLDADVVTFQELSSQTTLEKDLLSRRELAKKYPNVAWIKGNSDRGINVGIISKYPFNAVVTHKDEPVPLVDGSGTTKFSRDLLRVDVNTDNDPDTELTVYTTHSKSRLPAKPGEISADTQRISEGTAIRNIVQREMKEFPNRLWVVTGDMNDGTEDASVQAMLNPKDGGEHWVDSLGQLPEAQRNTWPANPTDKRYPPEQFDHVLIAESKKDQMLSSAPVRFEHSLDSDTRFVSSAASDHLPVLSKFEIKD